MFSPDEIEKLAALARIKLTETEKASLAKDVGSILGYVDQIKKARADADGREALDLVRNVMREDANPHESGEYTDALLAAAPQTENGYVKVKKIL